MPERFDAIVIGTGQAGPYVTSRLAGAGMKVAVIERKRFGGTCVNTGCIPTKTMVASAYAARMAARAAEYGVDVGSVRVDMKRVMARKDAVSKQSRTGLEDWLRNMENCTVYQGHARFESAHRCSVGGERLQRGQDLHQRRRPGARARPCRGFDEIDYLTNSSMMSVDFLPEHLIVVGGSYIGLEFGQMFRRFGAEVTVIEMGPRLVGREDEDVSTAIREIVEREGVEVRANAKCIGFAKRGEAIVASVDCADGGAASARHARAARRRPPSRIPTIWASRRRGSRSTSGATSWSTTSSARASRESGRSATATARGRSRTPRTTTARSSPPTCSRTIRAAVSDRITAYALYVDPPLGRAGMTEGEIRKSGRKALDRASGR